jgi:hypothetical protein
MEAHEHPPTAKSVMEWVHVIMAGGNFDITARIK